MTSVQVYGTWLEMQNVVAHYDVPIADAGTSTRHRPVRAESFPDHTEGDYEARESAYLRSLLADPLRELARVSADRAARVIAEDALAPSESSGDPFAEHAHLEDALERIATTTTDAATRATAEDAIALYRGR